MKVINEKQFSCIITIFSVVLMLKMTPIIYKGEAL
jgi:hypothetical protein